MSTTAPGPGQPSLVHAVVPDGGNSLEAAAALIKWLTDLGAEVAEVREGREGVDIRLSVGGTSLRRVLFWRSQLLARRNRQWTEQVAARCTATRRWLENTDGASSTRIAVTRELQQRSA